MEENTKVDSGIKCMSSHGISCSAVPWTDNVHL